MYNFRKVCVGFTIFIVCYFIKELIELNKQNNSFLKKVGKYNEKKSLNVIKKILNNENTFKNELFEKALKDILKSCIKCKYEKIDPDLMNDIETLLNKTFEHLKYPHKHKLYCFTIFKHFNINSFLILETINKKYMGHKLYMTNNFLKTHIHNDTLNIILEYVYDENYLKHLFRLYKNAFEVWSNLINRYMYD